MRELQSVRAPASRFLLQEGIEGAAHLRDILLIAQRFGDVGVGAVLLAPAAVINALGGGNDRHRGPAQDGRRPDHLQDLEAVQTRDVEV
jgi:hypothetical protein